jgi:hypothetical protein
MEREGEGGRERGRERERDGEGERENYHLHWLRISYLSFCVSQNAVLYEISPQKFRRYYILRRNKGRKTDDKTKNKPQRQTDNSGQTKCLTSAVRGAWDSAAACYRTPEGLRSLIKYFPFRILLDSE